MSGFLQEISLLWTLAKLNKSQSTWFCLATCGRRNGDSLQSDPGWLSLYSACWVWRKDNPACKRQNWVEERTPEVPEKKRGFKPSKMTDHKIEQMKER